MFLHVVKVRGETSEDVHLYGRVTLIMIDLSRRIYQHQDPSYAGIGVIRKFRESHVGPIVR